MGNMSLLELEWWAYLFIVLSFFIVCLGLNYVVKKINEAKIDERFIRMLQKASTTQSTQVNGPLIVMETSKGLRLNNNSKTAQLSPTGISLVFNQEENKRRKDLEDTFNIIKNSIDPRKLEALSLNTTKSLETVDVPPLIISDRNISEFVPVKMIESGRNTAKETAHTQSDRNLPDTVLVKKNEYGHVTKETSSMDQSDCYVTELISVKMNEYGYVSTRATSSVNTNEMVNFKNNESEHLAATESSSLIRSDDYILSDDFPINNSNINKSERIEPKETSSNDPSERNVGENVPIKTNESERIATPDISLKDSNVIGVITKTNEDIDSGSFIKKKIDSTLSKIGNTSKPPNEVPQNKKGLSDSIAVKETSSANRSAYNVTEVIPVKKSGFGCMVAKAISSLQSENVHDKKSEPECIAAKESPPDTQSDYIVPEFIPLKKSEFRRIVAKATSSHIEGEDSKVKEDVPVKKSESERISTKETSSHTRTDRIVTELSHVKMSEAGHIVVKATTSLIQSNSNVKEDILGKKSESGRSTAKAVSSHSRRTPNVTGFCPIKICGSRQFFAKETSSQTRSDRNVTQISPVIRSESGRITTKETSSNTPSSRNISQFVSVNMSVSINESRHIEDENTTYSEQSDCKASEYVPIKNNESGHIITKTNVSVISLKDSKVMVTSKKSNEDIKSDSLAKKTVDSTVPRITDTSKSTSQDPQIEIGLKERIKALLAPPVMNEDIMILKPNSSAKK